ncbi:cytochrome C [Sphingomonas oleivorans]|uniref:Cytochrome C n=2 Tax=Sphingomonas oleivorans TaxID=1735121 RepID=A0A2T5FTA5_9SPHN|nr:cytochrome C [Sphingomonas oleivorans]
MVLAGIASQAIGQSSGDGPGGGPTDGSIASSGEQVYQQICQACHMPDAKGGSGAGNIPALAANPNLKDASYPINVILRGKGGMPSFAGMIEPDQIAGVVGYLRTHFGNNYAEPVTEEDVKKIAASLPASDE